MNQLETKSSTVIVHSRKMAVYLQLQGFLLLGVQENLKTKNYKVFLFSDSNNLRKAMANYRYDNDFHTYHALLGR